MTAEAAAHRSSGQAARVLELALVLILLLNVAVAVGVAIPLVRHHDAWTRASQAQQHAHPGY